MRRFFYVGAVLAAAALLPAPTCGQMSAQNSSANSAQNGARVEHVAVRGTGAAMEVEIETSGAPVAPETQAITGPDRIVVDFPGALPSAALRALKVNRGALKGIRAGLFFSNPPITRIVLDLAEPQSYQISTTPISTTGNAIVVRLGPVKLSQGKRSRATAAGGKAPAVPAAPTARLQNASLAAGTNAAAARVSAAVANSPATPLPAVSAATTTPLVTVTFENGMLRIRAEKATLAQVLFEVQRQTQAEIAIPAGAEQEQVVADLGPAPARDVLVSLLNGSPYNFIFVGNELSLERVILTRRDPSIF